jgi:hypothetical protein
MSVGNWIELIAVLLSLVAAGVAYGRLTGKVDGIKETVGTLFEQLSAIAGGRESLRNELHGQIDDVRQKMQGHEGRLIRLEERTDRHEVQLSEMTKHE